MLIIGIDPGLSGSICFFKNGKILDVIEMPTMTEGKKNKKQVNGAQIYNEISERVNKTERNNIVAGKKINNLKLPSNDIITKIIDIKTKYSLLLIFEYK